MRIDRKRRAFEALFSFSPAPFPAPSPDASFSLDADSADQIRFGDRVGTGQGLDRETRILDMPEIDMMGFFEWRD